MLSKSMVLLGIPVAMALLAGAVLPFQAAGNAAVGRALGHWLWGAFTSLTVSSVVVIAALLILRVPTPDLGKALQGPWWLWIGGVLGALYVAGAAALTPKLGAAGFLVLVVAGQILTAVIADHFGVMGLGGKPVSLARVAGVVLILCGVFLVQGNWGSSAAAKPVVLEQSQR
ncbi:MULTISPECIES: DMT family transporter [Pseudomonas]|uniref:DMT family transporter n=1 Tax=Pseudomonas TaxID=286 RepID=UPI000A0BB683|nr:MULTISPECIES: DMT family transporter [Pseudomonas]MBC3486665.1 DMT family transporter [Pseudomonas sp. SWRI50]MBC3497667.1 DMT family transporter [Pseudomonas sp. SWRI67]MBV4526425.1 DMT family transporter [Pseudomonas kermanshahensis]SMF66371.1 transporter family-2 protein [Pseudomonas sp. LAIL14HWK12:I11]SMR81684.1 transporter family-2 protein [Pseudomonas sp. LAIL14HWK12:I10]